jgi:hypothetical protein
MGRSKDLAFYIGVLAVIGMIMLFRGLSDESAMCAPYSQLGIVPLKCMEASE